LTLRLAASVAATMVVLAGCQNEPEARQPPSGICDRAAAESLAGKDRIADDEVKRLTGATIVRQHKPGDPDDGFPPGMRHR
jgi:hypothetical protein